jgi:hypothetical protein
MMTAQVLHNTRIAKRIARGNHTGIRALLQTQRAGMWIGWQWDTISSRLRTHRNLST